jgi:hypothetical protein
MLPPPAPTIRIRPTRMGQELTLIKMGQELTLIKMGQELLLIRMTKAQTDSKLTIHFPSPLVHQNSRLMSGITVMRAHLKTSMILSSE